MAALASLFESALSGEPPKKMALAFADRLLRLGAGLAVISIAVLSGLSGLHWLVAAVAQGSCSQRSMTAARSGER